jgi:uncharacterized membrane protein YesL
LEMRGFMGGFYKISEWIMRLSVINILWVVCSIPFFYLALSTFTAPEFTVDMFMVSLILMGIVAPFTLVPATAAMFSVARKWVTGDEDVPLIKTFFRGYKENYVQSMLGGIVFLLLVVILYVNYRFYGNQSGSLKWLSFVFITMFIVLAASFLNYISIMVHLHMKFLQILKNSVLLTIGNPLNSLVILVGTGIILFFSFKFTWLIPFFMGSLIAILVFWQFHRSFVKMQERLEKMNAKEEEEAETAEQTE